MQVQVQVQVRVQVQVQVQVGACVFAHCDFAYAAPVSRCSLRPCACLALTLWHPLHSCRYLLPSTDSASPAGPTQHPPLPKSDLCLPCLSLHWWRSPRFMQPARELRLHSPPLDLHLPPLQRFVPLPAPPPPPPPPLLLLLLVLLLL